MNKADEQLKKFLLEKQAELTDRFERLRHEASRTDNPISADFEEQATEREGDDVNEEIKRVVQNELNDIKIALDRLEVGTYGICGECGDPIPIARLKAMPMAAYCTDCQEYLDHSNR